MSLVERSGAGTSPILLNVRLVEGQSGVVDLQAHKPCTLVKERRRERFVYADHVQVLCLLSAGHFLDRITE